MKKNIVFLTGTRADFGKLKSIIKILNESPAYEVNVFVTGMHMLKRYGWTADEVVTSKVCPNKNIYKFINQNLSDSMDIVLAKTIQGFSDYIKQFTPDLIVVHGDRTEALAGAIVGSLNNIRVAHIEGGEVSGTIDELIRHSISKMAHIHFVSNDQAKGRLVQLGENADCVHVIGSPDLDIMSSDTLPSLEDAKKRYSIQFDEYAIAMFHPVTTEIEALRSHAKNLTIALKESQKDYIFIYPNNDSGAEYILDEVIPLKRNAKFRIFPSMRFEHFLILLKHAQFMIGNSSAGIREAPFYGVPSINIGTRQKNRSTGPTIINASYESAHILEAIKKQHNLKRKVDLKFGEGKSNILFKEILDKNSLWQADIQKHFVDLT